MAANTDDIRTSVSKDIAALQQEVSRLQKMISAQGAEAYYEVRDRAGKAIDQSLPRAKNAVAQIRAESVAAAGAAREHVAATTTALALAGALGFLAGYLLSGHHQAQAHHWWR
ncbi:hypothetical protein AM571_CH03238 [Rhizobium etli 8C-3]|uniref:ElaB/YqjD/DUF883 family membrane-anchored ribosome-binding protein n=2 Tax=Rhizobium TaxID=379 RepID=A0A4R3QMS8_9HYPH|nr:MULTISPECIES: hypothetical protein [Rhizobium]APO76032.1 hypothetical protein AM571_CH03238 [Rhizobium etli 8C-3]TCU22524.1 ElaB/YqjD/DUF883 family membrane-anchored ribosome-binding protein [Rhizobium azibense]TCU28159.1 ElaB/YqjD/DUF883 family membrane-anchored ribosome-binding protein [Rhizobium azibense]